MSWETFTTDLIYMEDKEQKHFVMAGYQDSEIVALKQSEAKRTMLRDLKDALGLVETDDDFLSILTEHEDFLKDQLAKLQLALYFREDAGEAGSMNDNTAQWYFNSYLAGAKRFSKLRDVIPAPIRVTKWLR